MKKQLLMITVLVSGINLYPMRRITAPVARKTTTAGARHFTLGTGPKQLDPAKLRGLHPDIVANLHPEVLSPHQFNDKVSTSKPRLSISKDKTPEDHWDTDWDDLAKPKANPDWDFDWDNLAPKPKAKSKPKANPNWDTDWDDLAPKPKPKPKLDWDFNWDNLPKPKPKAKSKPKANPDWDTDWDDLAPPRPTPQPKPKPKLDWDTEF